MSFEKVVPETIVLSGLEKERELISCRMTITRKIGISLHREVCAVVGWFGYFIALGLMCLYSVACQVHAIVLSVCCIV